MVIVGAEVASPALDHEIRADADHGKLEVKEEKVSPISLKLKPSEMSVRSAAQIVQEQHGK